MAEEKRLIDANALTDKVDESKHNNPHPQGMVRVNHRNEHDHFLRMIMDAPTVDAVEVVRCKDCIYYIETVGKDYGKPCGYGSCGCTFQIITGIIYDEDFCSYGERKDNGEERA